MLIQELDLFLFITVLSANWGIRILQHFLKQSKCVCHYDERMIVSAECRCSGVLPPPVEGHCGVCWAEDCVLPEPEGSWKRFALLPAEWTELGMTVHSHYTSSSISSPLLSLVTSTSEISHQPVHTYTTYIWQRGRQNRKTGNGRKIQHYMRRERRKKKLTPRLCSIGEYSVRTEKKHLSTKAHIP